MTLKRWRIHANCATGPLPCRPRLSPVAERYSAAAMPGAAKGDATPVCVTRVMDSSPKAGAGDDQFRPFLTPRAPSVDRNLAPRQIFATLVTR